MNSYQPDFGSLDALTTPFLLVYRGNVAELSFNKLRGHVRYLLKNPTDAAAFSMKLYYADDDALIPAVLSLEDGEWVVRLDLRDDNRVVAELGVVT